MPARLPARRAVRKADPEEEPLETALSGAYCARCTYNMVDLAVYLGRRQKLYYHSECYEKGQRQWSPPPDWISKKESVA